MSIGKSPFSPGFEGMNLVQLEKWMDQNDLTNMSYADLTARLILDLPSQLSLNDFDAGVTAQIGTPPRARANQTGIPTVGATTANQPVPFISAAYTTLASGMKYNNALGGGNVQVPLTGYYQIFGQVTGPNATAAGFFQLVILVNGSVSGPVGVSAVAATDIFATATVSDEFKLSAGDIVGLGFSNETSGSITCNSSSFFIRYTGQ